jgi:KDO2-lipid IV(A) lauroyltransferase
MKIFNFLIITLLKTLSYIPLGILYGISTGFYYLLYYVIGYRKKVVFENLNNSFPEKSELEKLKIAKGFYRYFADMIIEIIKSHSMNVDDFKEHVTFKNIDEINKVYDAGKSIVLLTTHYGNWEWWVYAPHFLKHKLLIVYLPLENKLFDKYMNSLRTKFGGVMLPLKETFRTVLDHHNRQEQTLTWICADQTARWNNKFWVKFLNQETSFFTGGERIAKKTNQAVYFLDVQKQGRGKYVLEFKEYSSNPKGLDDNRISIDYAKDLEKLIRKKPDYWLWSHKRWKHKRQEDLPVYE